MDYEPGACDLSTVYVLYARPADTYRGEQGIAIFGAKQYCNICNGFRIRDIHNPFLSMFGISFLYLEFVWRATSSKSEKDFCFAKREKLQSATVKDFKAAEPPVHGDTANQNIWR